MSPSRQALHLCRTTGEITVLWARPTSCQGNAMGRAYIGTSQEMFDKALEWLRRWELLGGELDIWFHEDGEIEYVVPVGPDRMAKRKEVSDLVEIMRTYDMNMIAVAVQAQRQMKNRSASIH